MNEERGRLDIRNGHLLDPRNRDPNFLATSELQTNSWFQQMLRASQAWSFKFGPDLEALHVDVHGCQDPPNTPSHLTVGLGAMCFHASDLGDTDGYENAMCFGHALCKELGQVLAKAEALQALRPRAALVRLAAPGVSEEKASNVCLALSSWLFRTLPCQDLRTITAHGFLGLGAAAGTHSRSRRSSRTSHTQCSWSSPRRSGASWPPTRCSFPALRAPCERPGSRRSLQRRRQRGVCVKRVKLSISDHLRV